MRRAVIDIGSNSMRLSVYEVEQMRFKTLFKEKIMAGLAGYVEEHRLSVEGIACACRGLLEFRKTLELLGIREVAVFATASLRNIDNTKEAVEEIQQATGLEIEVISGQEEALLGYVGAMQDLQISDGIFIDIGGASTEIAYFSDGSLSQAVSIPIGSLKLYREYVKKLLPGREAQRRMEEKIAAELSDISAANTETPSETELSSKDLWPEQMVCVGGSARAALKLAKRMFSLSEHSRSFSVEQLNSLCETLCLVDKQAIDLILKTEPERVHTMIPGLLILRSLAREFHVKTITVSGYGVREGYLCQRIQSKM